MVHYEIDSQMQFNLDFEPKIEAFEGNAAKVITSHGCNAYAAGTSELYASLQLLS